MLTKLTAALHATHVYCQDMCSKIAPDKSYNFATSPTAREWLEQTWWGAIQSNIPVVKGFRYLGAHVNTGGGRRNGTGDDRHTKGMVQLAKLKRLPIDLYEKRRR